MFYLNIDLSICIILIFDLCYIVVYIYIIGVLFFLSLDYFLFCEFLLVLLGIGSFLIFFCKSNVYICICI